MIAIFYDVENLQTLENCENAINEVKKIIQNQSSLQFAYAEWGRFNNEYRQLFINYGIVQKQVINGVGYHNNIKNAADIALSIDAIELIIKNPAIDHIVLVSGDGGYISLVNKLKEYGKFISIVSLDQNLNNSLVHYANNVHRLKKEVKEKIYTESKTENKPINEKETVERFKEYTQDEKENIVFRDKTVWAIAKNSIDLEEFCNQIVNSRPILDSLHTEPLGIYFLVKSYLKAKDVLGRVPFHKEKDNAISYFDKMENSKVYIRSGKMYLKTVQAQPKEIKQEIVSDIDLEAELFKNNIISSKGDALDKIIVTYINSKNIFVQFNEEEQIEVLKSQSRSRINFVKSVVSMFSLLSMEEIEKINPYNYTDILSARISLFLSTKEISVTRNKIKEFFGWQDDKISLDILE